MSKLKVGIIGCGHMGQYHLNILMSLPNVTMAGFADTDEKRVEDLSIKYGIPGYTDYHKLLGKVDAVCIAVPTVAHYNVAIDCIKEKKHILIEKPITKTLDEAKDIIDKAEAGKLILQVGHVERFNAAIQQLGKIIINPNFVETRRMGPYNPRVKDIGVVLDLMIHDIDIVIGLVQSEVININAFGSPVVSDFEDVASAQLLFKNGCVASISASRISQQKARTLAVTQKDSFVFLDYNTQEIQVYRRASAAYLLTPEEIKYTQDSFVEHIQVHKENPLKLELVHFVNCVLKKETPVVTNSADLKAFETTIEVLKKIQEQRNV